MSIIKSMVLHNANQVPKLSDKVIEAIKNKPITYDEYLPKFTKEELSQFKHHSQIKHRYSDKDIVRLRKNEIRKASKVPIVYDEDCPKLTKEELSQFKRVHPNPEIETIKRLRKEKDIDQKTLAALTGISQADISRIENGKTNPTLETLRKIANAFGKSIKVIFV